MNVVELEKNKCIKLVLPNDKTVDILSAIVDKLLNWVQDSIEKPESGGYIVGYEHLKTGNIILEDISVPQSNDTKTRIFFKLKDTIHKLFIKSKEANKSYYMGVWHTHPQSNPVPSSIDWNDWHETLELDKTGCDYIFFIIVGITSTRVWVGSKVTKEIIEIFECKKNKEGIYE